MLSDLDCARLCEAQYNGDAIFDYDFTVGGDRYCIKKYDDCTAIIHEGSHDFLNWFNNAIFNMVQIPDFGGVDQGFDINVPHMTIQALPLVPKDKPVFFTGHSRGAPRALLMAARFVLQGYDVRGAVFASPRPGDAKISAILAKTKITSYRNYHDWNEQDWVCDVPLVLPFHYVHPINAIGIDEAPLPCDPWGPLARHHIQLYAAGVEKLHAAK